MTKGELIDVSKRMVREYYNRYVEEKEGLNKISLDDVEVIGFHDETNNYRILLSTPTTDGIYYEVVYDCETNELRSYVYRKAREKTHGKDKGYYRTYYGRKSKRNR